jgi:hypothetical protein
LEDQVDHVFNELDELPPSPKQVQGHADEDDQISFFLHNSSNKGSSVVPDQDNQLDNALPDLNELVAVVEEEVPPAQLAPGNMGQQDHVDLEEGNFLAHEIQEDGLMNDDELLKEKLLANEQQGPMVPDIIFNSNLSINMALPNHPEQHRPDPDLMENFLKKG